MDSSKKNLILAFDLYGTILSTESIAKELAKHFGEEKAASLATTWRKYQLEYTWRLNSMKQYIPFSDLTHQSLKHTLTENNLTLSSSSITDLMSSYDSLSLFPDVDPALSSLASSSNTSITPVIFSNGTNEMVSNSVYKSAELSPHAKLFKDIVTVDEVQIFKPAPEVYHHLAEKMGKDVKSEMGEIVLVSGNPFDVVGGKAVGMRAIWVDRQGAGWSDRLVEGGVGQPDAIVRGLGEVVDVVRGWL